MLERLRSMRRALQCNGLKKTRALWARNESTGNRMSCRASTSSNRRQSIQSRSRTPDLRLWLEEQRPGSTAKLMREYAAQLTFFTSRTEVKVN